MHWVEKLSHSTHLSDNQQSFLHDCHHGSVSDVDLALAKQTTIIVAHDHVGTLTRYVDVLTFPQKLGWCKSQRISLSSWHPGLLLELTVATHQIVSLQEVKHVLGCA
jgi:hypothetical protein